MDVLSDVASVIAVLQITVQVVTAAFSYADGVANASSEKADIFEQLTRLKEILTELQKFADRKDADGVVRFRLLKSYQDKGLLGKIANELRELQEKVKPVTGRLNKAASAMVYPLKDGPAIKKILVHLQGYHSELDRVLTMDVGDVVLTLEDNIQELQQTIERNANHALTQTVCDWLYRSVPVSNHNTVSDSRDANTGAWFFEEPAFLEWKEGSRQLFWLYGISGCGKSVLCSNIIQTVQEHCPPGSDKAIAYFYFDFNHENDEVEQHNNMVRSLIAQLVVQLPSPPGDELGKLYSPGAQVPPRSVLMKVLKTMLGSFKQAYIVLDALDECRKHLSALLKLLQQMTDWQLELNNLSILVTSQRLIEIENSFSPKVSSFNLGPQIKRDITAFIHTKLQTPSGWADWPTKSVRQKIASELTQDGKNMDGMFRLAALQLELLQKCFTPRDIQKALQTMPRTLDTFYDRILCSIDVVHRPRALKILQWLVFSFRPMQPEEINDAITMDVEGCQSFDPEDRFPDPAKAIQTICSGLVTLQTHMRYDYRTYLTPVIQVHLAHSSVKDYLITKPTLNHPASWYDFTEETANLLLSHTCMKYLVLLDKPLGDGPMHITPAGYPLAMYAARYWMAHADRAGKPVAAEFWPSGDGEAAAG